MNSKYAALIALGVATLVGLYLLLHAKKLASITNITNHSCTCPDEVQPC